jgi:hypothetical protein
MAVTATPVFTQGVSSAQCVCMAAKTTYNDAANAVLLLAAGPNGAVVYAIRAIPRGTVTQTQCQIFRSPDLGVTMNLIDCAVMGAYTLTQTSAPTKTDFGYSETLPLRVGPNERPYAGVGVALASGVVFDAQYENL